MYPIAASFRSKMPRMVISVSSTNAASILAKSFPKHSAASLSFFATGSSSFTGTPNGQEPQRRPFWATSPVDEPKVNDAVKVAPPIDATVGLASEEATSAKKKTDKPKKASKAKAAKKEDTPPAEIVIPETDKDIWNVDYLSRVLAIKNDLGIGKSKQIIDDIFDIVTDGILKKKQIKIARFGIFETKVAKEKTMTNIQTKEKYAVPAKCRAVFKISSVLRGKVSELELPADAEK